MNYDAYRFKRFCNFVTKSDVTYSIDLCEIKTGKLQLQPFNVYISIWTLKKSSKVCNHWEKCLSIVSGFSKFQGCYLNSEFVLTH